MTFRKKKGLLFGLVALAFLLVLIAAFPLWFPWALRPALRHFGVRFGRYQRIGYARFALADTTFAMEGKLFRARRIEAFLPTAWVWHHSLRHTNQVFLELNDW